MRFAEPGRAALVIFRDSSNEPMNFSGRASRLVAVSFFSLGMVSCHQPISPEEKATRAQLRAALRAKNWEQAIPLGRKVLELSPHEDGSWARLAEAQIGQRDVPGLKVTIDRWEQEV